MPMSGVEGDINLILGRNHNEDKGVLLSVFLEVSTEHIADISFLYCKTEKWVFLISILQRRKLRLKEIKYYSQ